MASFLKPPIQPATEDQFEVPAPTTLEWASLHRRIDDQPFTLEKHKPLRALYEDEHPFIVVIKPAQVGVSEWAITSALHALDVGARYWKTGKSGLNVGYLFSTDKALSSFSKERFSGIREETEYLSSLFDAYDDVGFKKAGASYLYLRGGKSTSGLKSFSADELIFDEYDEMSPMMIALGEKRLRASVLKRQKRISTPSLPNYGIDALYQQSDQKVWEVPCALCGEWNELDFFRDVRAEGVEWEVWRDWEQDRLRYAHMTVRCASCKAEIDRLRLGRWTKLRPEIKGVSGYKIPALSFPSVSLNELAVNAVSRDPSQITEFFRSDLGLPYEPAGSRITLEMLKALSVELQGGHLPPGPWTKTTMGVDVGSLYHFRISSTGPDSKRYVRKMGSVRTLQELDGLIENFSVRHVVIDALPELNSIKSWSDRHKGKVYRAFYPNSDLGGEMFRLPETEEKKRLGIAIHQPTQVEKDTIQINRTMAMDAVYNLVATADERWPAEIHNDSEVIAHMKAPVRVIVTDEMGQPRAVWQHTAPDHLFHACVYDHVALQTLPKQLPGTLGLGSVKGWGL